MKDNLKKKLIICVYCRNSEGEHDDIHLNILSANKKPEDQCNNIFYKIIHMWKYPSIHIHIFNRHHVQSNA